MPAYFLKRFLGLIPLFFGITCISFLVIHLVPGGPVDASELNPKMSWQAKQKLEQLYGLDRPLAVQYAQWVGRLVRLDFGRSFVDGQSVTRKIAQSLPVTLWINGLALLLICLLGVPLGIVSALSAETAPPAAGAGAGALDKIVTALVMAGFALPSFWVAMLALSFFGVQLRVLPVSGLVSLFHDQLPPLARAMDVAGHLALPVGVTCLAGLAGIASFTRNNMIEALRQPYIQTARAKGLSERRVVYGHALSNAVLPLVTMLGLAIPGLVGGSVIVESIFSVPGMGRLFFNSVFSRDYPVIMGILVLGAALTLLGNWLADVVYGLVDPRILFGGRDQVKR